MVINAHKTTVVRAVIFRLKYNHNNCEQCGIHLESSVKMYGRYWPVSA